MIRFSHLIQKNLPWLLWLLFIPLMALNIWSLFLIFNYFSAPITVFISANLIAFLLEYLVQKLQRHGVSRVRAVSLIFFSIFVGILFLGFTVIPILADQLNQLILNLPSWIVSASEQIEIMDQWVKFHRIPIDLSGLDKELLNQVSNQVPASSALIFNWLISAAGGILEILFEFIFTAVITFYLLLKGNHLWDGVFQWFRPSLSLTLRTALRQSFHNYFIGQLSLGGLIGLAMTVTFLILQIPFGLLFGVGIGVMAIFPFGAGVSILAISLLFTLKSFWLGIRFFAIATLIDQVIENAIAPRLLGNFTGVNPVWVLLSILIGAKIAGFLGVVLAVPVAAFIKSMLELLNQKRQTPLEYPD